MRENFDYVTMDTYAADMAESSSHAAGIIDMMKEKQRNAERGLIAAVLAAGGRIVLGPRDLMDADGAILRIERNDADDTTILTACR